MSDGPTLVYLEADDEVTTVARRLRDAGGERVVLVTPGRSRATSSVVALRLLAAVAEEAGVRIEVVGDALTRSLASEAGLGTYASVDDARNAVPAPPGETASRRASIHVVRGDALDETAAAPAMVTPAPTPIDDATELRTVPVAARTPARSRPRWRGVPAAAVVALLAALVVGGGVLGAVLLPAATIVVTPRSEPIGPAAYEISIDEPERATGTVEAAATVTATGTYPIQAFASGTVILFNWTSTPQPVAAGTLVAAGRQAFATQSDVTVPRGMLTPEGTIAAGSLPVPVIAAAVGPAANVPAKAIDTVLTQDVDGRLRGFPENPERRVDNLEATAGGVDTTGSEFVEADVDAAIEALRADLDAQLNDALGSGAGSVFADVADAPEPVIQGVDGLIGTRDQPEAQITGSLAYDRLSAERAEVVDRAEEELVADETVLSPGHELLEGTTLVSVGDARAEGDRLVVSVTVTGAAAAGVDRGDVLARVRGRSAQEAEAAIADLGDATVSLWPDWVGSVPELDWRIDMVIGDAPGGAVPSVRP